ncbi:MAG: hypothetical protein HOG03_24125 [Desulfobacula sp.]|jgi:hypothetical protein|uniref:hypothetical protein n=1 Tax=Desulfobacula sp. TaxID=2593537 RepID=UPI001ECA3E33|nr:hypothetical protein [Desulfobacula sp.]
MTPTIKKEVAKAFRESKGSRPMFFKLILKNTGLKRQAFKRGYLADYVKRRFGK